MRRLPRRTRLAAALTLALALPAAPALALDLLESYQLATRNDGQLKAARARADADKEALPQAIGPTLAPAIHGETSSRTPNATM